MHASMWSLSHSDVAIALAAHACGISFSLVDVINKNNVTYMLCEFHFFARPFFKNASQRKAVEAAPRQQMLK